MLDGSPVGSGAFGSVVTSGTGSSVLLLQAVSMAVEKPPFTVT
ncbi:MAG: hypothetical protein ABWY29_13165 [Blastococcus sp.]